MKPYEILFINNTSKLGAGTSQSLLLLVKYLSKSFSLSVVSDRHSDELPDALQKFNVPYFGFRDRTVLFFPQLGFHILSRKIDLVYANNLSGRCLVAFFAAKFTSKPFIWHIRESINDTKRGRMIRFSDAVIANSQDTANRLVKFAGVKAPLVVPNGVELDDFDLDVESCRTTVREKLGCEPNSLLVINMGRICEQKDQPQAVRAALKVLESHPHTHFLFLGDLQDPDYVNQMNQQISVSEYQNQFHILGHINDFIPYLLASDVLLHTARREPQGRVILEAMAAKLPVVTYEIGGVGEAVVQGETGYLRPFGDIDGLVSDLNDLLENEPLRQKMGKAGYLRVKNQFTADNTSISVKRVIEDILIKSKGGI